MTLIVPRRVLIVATAGLIVLLLALAFSRGAGSVFSPRTVADRALTEQQRTGAERSIQRSYSAAVGQLDRVKSLTLAIPATEAAQIDAKARTDLRALRRDVLIALGQASGLTGAPLAGYVQSAEASLDQGGSSAEEPGTLLAPTFFDIVRRAGEAFQRISDDAVRQLTRSPSPSPSPSLRGSASPSPSR